MAMTERERLFDAQARLLGEDGDIAWRRKNTYASKVAKLHAFNDNDVQDLATAWLTMCRKYAIVECGAEEPYIYEQCCTMCLENVRVEWELHGTH